MGYENRDYARDDINRSGWGPVSHSGGGFRDWPVWKKIVAANVVVFLLQMFLVRSPNAADYANFEQVDDPVIMQELEYEMEMIPDKISIVEQWCRLDTSKVLSGQIWRVITCGFCHDRFGIWHIVMNMLFLYWFGSRLEMRYGSQEFAVFYFAALLASSFAYMALDLYTGRSIPAIGASGAVWGIVALYALLYPYDTIYIYFLFPVQIWCLALIYFLYDLHPVVLELSGQRVFSGVGHSAHVGGAVFGYLYYRNNWQLAGILDRFTGQKTSKRFANSRPRQNQKNVVPMFGPYKKLEPTDGQKMDQILEKISSQGRESLSEDEEQFLLHQSAKIREQK